MRISCKFSGIEFTVSAFSTNGKAIEGIHPAFYCKQSFLLSRTGDWAAARLDVQERKILFLALLNSTDLVEFRTTAFPADSTVQSNMESLIRFIGWQSAIHTPRLALPRFVISPETRELPNVQYWLEAWWSAKQEFEDGYMTSSQLTKLRNREAALEKLIKNATKTSEDYSGILASWALESTNAPQSIREYWTSLFKLKGLQVYNASKVDLEELVEHMEEFLQHGSIYAFESLKHVKTLLAKNKAGLNYGLGMSAEELENTDFLALEKHPFSIVEDSVETHNRQIQIDAAPNSEPSPLDYPNNRVAYLRAKARWNLSQRSSYSQG